MPNQVVVLTIWMSKAGERSVFHLGAPAVGIQFRADGQPARVYLLARRLTSS